MKYLSEITGLSYDTEKECLDAEKESKSLAEKKKKEQEDLRAQRKEDALKIDEARKKAEESYNQYVKDESEKRKLINEFVKKYGSYNTTYRSTIPIRVTSPYDMFSDIFNSFFDF